VEGQWGLLDGMEPTGGAPKLHYLPDGFNVSIHHSNKLGIYLDQGQGLHSPATTELFGRPRMCGYTGP